MERRAVRARECSSSRSHEPKSSAQLGRNGRANDSPAPENRLPWRTLAHRAIYARVGVELWERLWQKLRSSFDEEWAMTFPRYAVSKWAGHSTGASARHWDNAVPREFSHKPTERTTEAPEGARKGA